MLSVPLAAAPLRVASGPEGRAFVLTGGGWVHVYDADGSLRGAWPAGPLDAEPTDLALDAAGKLYVSYADGVVRMFERSMVGGQTQPVSAGSGNCSTTTSKLALPHVLHLGETTDVELAFAANCAGVGNRVSVVLATDRSSSMAGAKLHAAKDAAIRLTARLAASASPIGVVSFAGDVRREQDLSTDCPQVVSALAGLVADGPTNLVGALEESVASVLAGSSPDDQRTIVFLSDGQHSYSAVPIESLDPVLESVRQNGIVVYAVGVAGADEATLLRIAGDPDRYYYAPSGQELASIYEDIAQRIDGGSLLKEATVTDVLPANMTYVPGFGAPFDPEYTPDTRTLTWRFTNVEPGGLRLKARVRPAEPGQRRRQLSTVGQGDAQGTLVALHVYGE